MKLFLIKEKANINATAEYNVAEKTFTVLKGSILSSTISSTEKFRGAKAIEKARTSIVKDNVLSRSVTFKSSSTAANFVTGASTNGLLAWKDKNGKKLKDILTEMEESK